MNIHQANRVFRKQRITDWQSVADAFVADAREINLPIWWDEGLMSRAIDRLVCGNVRGTEFGIAVAVNRGLGDNRVGAGNYWPFGDSGCRCWKAKQDSQECSHRLAAEVFRFDMEGRRP